MYNFSRLFVVDNGEASGWSGSTKTSFVFLVKNDWLSVQKKSGRNMFVNEIITALYHFLKEYEAEFGEKITVCERSDYYRFCMDKGYSGCRDYFIETDSGDGYPNKEHLLHVSSYGKVAGFECFFHDFADLCVAAKKLFVEEDYYVCPREEGSDSAVEMDIVKPRMTEYEVGWSSPWARPDTITGIEDVVREKPNNED